MDKDKDLHISNYKSEHTSGYSQHYRSLPRLVIPLASIPNLVSFLLTWFIVPENVRLRDAFTFWCHSSKPKLSSPSCPASVLLH